MKMLISIIFLALSSQAFAFPNQGKLPNQKKVIDNKAVLQAFVQHAKNIDSSQVKALPVSNQGRIKPLDTMSRETILYLAGSSSKWGVDAVQIYLALMTFSHTNNLEIIEARDKDIRVTLGYAKSKRFFSLNQLREAQIDSLAKSAQAQEKKNRKLLNDKQKAILEVLHQSWTLGAIVNSGQLFQSVNFSEHNHDNTNVITPLQNYLRALSPDQPKAVAAQWATQLSVNIKSQEMNEQFRSQIQNIDLEVWYNKAHLFLLTGIFYLLIAIAIFLPNFSKYLSNKVIYITLAIPILMHSAGFLIRIYITSFPPVTNMYGTMLWVSYGISLISALFFYLYKNKQLLSVFLVGASFILLLTEFIPLILSPNLDPIVAVLRSSLWLTIHVLTITLAYAAFSLSLLLGNIAIIRYIITKKPNLKDEFYKTYGHYAYRSIQLGVFLITTGIILGGVWADYSWGRFWGWDPKETWALIADLGYLLILHARFTGWLTPFGLLVASPFAYLLVIMAWYGVNFILAAGLHSYGFSSGGAAIVGIYFVTQIVVVAIAGGLYLKRRE